MDAVHGAWTVHGQEAYSVYAYSVPFTVLFTVLYGVRRTQTSGVPWWRFHAPWYFARPERVGRQDWDGKASAQSLPAPTKPPSPCPVRCTACSVCVAHAQRLMINIAGRSTATQKRVTQCRRNSWEVGKTRINDPRPIGCLMSRPTHRTGCKPWN